MLKKLGLVVIVSVLLAAPPAIAQETKGGPGGHCTLAGTWIGGSDAKYQSTFIPITPWRYFSEGQGTYLPPPPNVVASTWTGDVVWQGPQGWRVRLVQTASTSGALFPDTADLSVGAVEGTIELVDCNTFVATYHFFEIYFWDSLYGAGATKELFVNAGDVPAPPTPIVETFQRAPTW
jgi:hypothetical protein